MWKTKEKLTSFWWLLWKVLYLFKGKESKFFFRLKVWLKCFVIFDYIWDSLDMKLPKPIAEHNWSTLSWKPLKIIIIFTGWRLELDLQYFPLAEQNSVRDNLRIFLARNHFSPQNIVCKTVIYDRFKNWLQWCLWAQFPWPFSSLHLFHPNRLLTHPRTLGFRRAVWKSIPYCVK